MRHRVRPAPAPRLSEVQPPAAALAGLSNQALARLLARAPKPDPHRTNVKEIADLNATIGPRRGEAR